MFMGVVTPLGTTPYRLVFEKSYHFLVELKHNAYWAIQTLTRERQTLQLNKLDELRLEAYESSKIHKEWTKHWHDKHIMKKKFEEGDMVLLFNFKMRLFPSKLRS